MIRARYLEALEDDRFQVIPAGPYARSFLREYADFLGLEGEILVAEYELRFAPREPEPVEPPTRSEKVARRLSELPLRPILITVGVLAVVALGVSQLGRSSGTETSTETLTQPATAAPPVVAPAAKPRVTVTAVRPSLSLTAARGTCWLSVRIGSSGGATIYERTLQQGESVRFGLQRPLWIRIGAPWNVDVTLGKRAVTASLPPRTGDVLASTSGLQTAA